MKSENIKKIAIWSAIAVVVVMITAALIICFTFDSWNDRGTFGDMFGTVNALFSGLAFVGLIITLLQQKEELTLQRKELTDTRKEMESQRKEFEEQNTTSRYQRFENTFFQMVSLHQEIVNGLSYTFEKEDLTQKNPNDFKSWEKNTKSMTFQGRAVFQHLLKNIKVSFGDLEFANLLEAIQSQGLVAYEKSDLPEYFDHYFRYLYRILKYVDETPLLPSTKEKYTYTSILRGQLSRYELVWLYYNCLSLYGNEKFKPLIEKYAFLKNIRNELLVKSENLGKYNPCAFEYTDTP